MSKDIVPAQNVRFLKEMLEFLNVCTMIDRAICADSPCIVKPFIGFTKFTIKKDNAPIHGFIKNEPIVVILVGYQVQQRLSLEQSFLNVLCQSDFETNSTQRF